MAPLIFSTALTFALSPLPRLPHRLLFSSVGCGGLFLGRLPKPLWQKVAEYLCKWPTASTWWQSTTTPLVLRGSTVRMILYTPSRLQANHFFPRILINELALHDVDVHRDWELPCFGKLRETDLCSIAACSLQHPIVTEPSVDAVVLASGIVLRLQAQIRVLLLGDFSTDIDLTIAEIVSSKLGTSHIVSNPRQFPGCEFPNLVDDASPLIFARHDPHTATPWQEQAKLLSELIDRNVSWRFASIHFACMSLDAQVQLREQLPRNLSQALVFV